jgi:hypothetical protein
MWNGGRRTVSGHAVAAKHMDKRWIVSDMTQRVVGDGICPEAAPVVSVDEPVRQYVRRVLISIVKRVACQNWHRLLEVEVLELLGVNYGARRQQ